MDKNKQIIISLGGSLIIPDEIDVEFLKSFVKTITEYVAKDFSFIIICGGGKICRKYNASLEQITNPSNEDLDWLGISTTRVNAELVRICFGDLAYEKVLQDPNIIPETNKSIIIGGGWKPGNSSELATIYLAKNLGATKIINLSNVDYVYTKDPRTNPEAQPIEKMTWKDFRGLFSKEWNPGSNAPFDPIAALEAEQLGYEVVIIDGKNIESLKSYLDGEPFVGTTIK